MVSCVGSNFCLSNMSFRLYRPIHDSCAAFEQYQTAVVLIYCLCTEARWRLLRICVFTPLGCQPFFEAVTAWVGIEVAEPDEILNAICLKLCELSLFSFPVSCEIDVDLWVDPANLLLVIQRPGRSS